MYIGTHVDAPFHFSREGITVDQIPLSSLIGHCRVIDISRQVDTNPDYCLSVEDIVAYESAFGILEANDIVVVKTGWHKHWQGGATQYLGFDETVQGKYDSTTSSLSFPGIGEDAANYLVSNHIAGVGIDTASLDPGSCKRFLAHRILLGAGIYGIENLNGNVELIPPVGSSICIMPLKLTGGSGAPARVIFSLAD